MVFYSNQREKYMDLQELERIVAEILQKPALHRGIEKYTRISNTLHKDSVVTNRDFQSVYADFYGLNRVWSDEEKQKYFAVMEKFKTKNKISKQQARIVFDAVCHVKEQCDISFSSKMIHHFNKDLPIWDSVVAGDHFYFEACTKGDLEYREKIMWKRYWKYKNQFYRYMESAEGKKIIELFDEYFPDSKWISKVKKLDFVLWQDKKLLES